MEHEHGIEKGSVKPGDRRVITSDEGGGAGRVEQIAVSVKPRNVIGESFVAYYVNEIKDFLGLQRSAVNE